MEGLARVHAGQRGQDCVYRRGEAESVLCLPPPGPWDPAKRRTGAHEGEDAVAHSQDDVHPQEERVDVAERGRVVGVVGPLAFGARPNAQPQIAAHPHGFADQERRQGPERSQQSTAQRCEVVRTQGGGAIGGES